MSGAPHEEPRGPAQLQPGRRREAAELVEDLILQEIISPAMKTHTPSGIESA